MQMQMLLPCSLQLGWCQCVTLQPPPRCAAALRAAGLGVLLSVAARILRPSNSPISAAFFSAAPTGAQGGRADMAQLEAALRASAEAINELRESLDEQCLSEIAVEGSVARFWVRAEDGSETRFAATFSGSSLPAPCVLEVAGGAAARGLARANTRLAGGASLAKAVTGAGRAVGVDLDWTAEAEGDGEFWGWGGGQGLPRARCTAAAAAALAPPPPAVMVSTQTTCRQWQRRGDGGCWQPRR